MHTRHALLVAALCLSLTPLANAQDSQTAAPAAGPNGQSGSGAPQQQRRAREPYKPKNLQVLPENVDIDKVMRQYSGDLGVGCSFCHAAPDPVTHRSDRASDANPMKNVARTMIRMNDDINEKYLTQLPKHEDHEANPENVAKVDCGTCHRGHSQPEAFVPPPSQEGPRGPRPGMTPGTQPPPSPPPAQ